MLILVSKHVKKLYSILLFCYLFAQLFRVWQVSKPGDTPMRSGFPVVSGVKNSIGFFLESAKQLSWDGARDAGEWTWIPPKESQSMRGKEELVWTIKWKAYLKIQTKDSVMICNNRLKVWSQKTASEYWELKKQKSNSKNRRGICLKIKIEVTIT